MSLPPDLVIDRHVLAGITIGGMTLDLLGALYLTYELLGGKHGPLRGLTLSITFGLSGALAVGLGGGAVAWLIAGPQVGLAFALAGGLVVGLSTALGAGVGFALSINLGGGFSNGLKGAIAGSAAGILGGGLTENGPESPCLQAGDEWPTDTPPTNRCATLRPDSCPVPTESCLGVSREVPPLSTSTRGVERVPSAPSESLCCNAAA